MLLTDALTRARDLIRDPDHWTQDAFARDPLGEPCAVDDPLACRWCLIGALWKTVKDFWPAVQLAYKVTTRPAWDNDRLVHGDVLRLLDWAIREEAKREKKQTEGNP